MPRRSALVTSVAAVLALLTGVGSARTAPAPAPTSTAMPAAPTASAPVPAIDAALTSAVALARAGGLGAGVAVLDTLSGDLWSAGRATHQFPSASVVKTMIATRLLLTNRMTGTVGSQAWAMITRSDNAAAWALYPQVGRDGLLPWLAKHYGIADLGAPPSMPGVWGSTRISAQGLVRFYQAVHGDPAVWPWLSRAMHAYASTSSGGEPNAFGIAVPAPGAAIKNGWDTDRDVARPRAAIINSTGFVDRDRYAVAILTEGPGSLYYSGGEQVVTRAAGELVPAVFALRDYARSGPTGGTAAVTGSTATAARATTTTTWRATVVLDPGHDGGNASHPAQVNRQVYAGYGRYKNCNTTGTATNAGYPEHAFTWRVALRVKHMLNLKHVRVIMTRTSDTGVGPCVNRRAAIESTAGAALAVAIHADGSSSYDHGFHLCVDSRRPEGATAATVRKTHRLDQLLRLSLQRHSTISVANYVGNNGYYYRDDLAGLNLSTNPTAFLEIGNMRNAHDAHVQSTPEGRGHIAYAIAHGILNYLFH